LEEAEEKKNEDEKAKDMCDKEKIEKAFKNINKTRKTQSQRMKQQPSKKLRPKKIAKREKNID